MTKGSSGEVLRIANALVGRIVSGDYPAGLRLPPEVALATEFGCGRSTLREALQHLATLGLVKSRRGSGVLVLDFRREGTLALLPAYLRAGRFEQPLPLLAKELLRTRRLLAVEAARLAATYADEGALVEAEALQQKLVGLTHDPVAHTLVEMALFRALLSASRVWPAVWFANAFWEPLAAVHEQFAGLIGFLPEGHAAMVSKLLTLVRKRDAERASALVDAHFARVDAEVIPRIERLLTAAAEPPSIQNIPASPRKKGAR